jgi:hypothetical protein
MSLNGFKWLTIYVLVSIPIFIIGMYISFTSLYNGNDQQAFIIFIITSFNLVIALWLPFIITITNLIKR